MTLVIDRRAVRSLSDYFSSPVLAVLSFVASAIVGAVLLYLPVSHYGSLSLIDAWFVSVSAICVTGLSPIDIGSVLTPTGRWVLLALIQLGGIGAFAFSVGILSLFFGHLSLSAHRTLKSQFFFESHKSFGSIFVHIFVLTFVVETLGALALYFSQSPNLPLERGEFYFHALFTSVSAFCNAGFGLLADNLMSAHDQPVVLSIVMSSIILGGIGFFTLWELRNRLTRRGGARHDLSLHTRVVLVSTVFLILGGALFVFLLEQDHSLQGMSLSAQVWNALFQSVTARTAGFNTVDIGAMQDSTLAVLMSLMFIGGGPGSAAGGIKVTTIALLLTFVWSLFRGAGRTNMFRRTVPEKTVLKALAIFFMSVITIFTCALALSLFEQSGLNRPFIDYLFECVSAFGTVGLSTGVTGELSPASKLVISILMFIGRLGPLTLITCFYIELSERSLRYAEENVMVG